MGERQTQTEREIVSYASLGADCAGRLSLCQRGGLSIVRWGERLCAQHHSTRADAGQGTAGRQHPWKEPPTMQPSRRWNDAKPMGLPHSARGFRGVPLRLHAEVPEAEVAQRVRTLLDEHPQPLRRRRHRRPGLRRPALRRRKSARSASSVIGIDQNLDRPPSASTAATTTSPMSSDDELRDLVQAGMLEAVSDFQPRPGDGRHRHRRADAADAQSQPRPAIRRKRHARTGEGTCGPASSSASNRRPIPAPPRRSCCRSWKRPG